MTISYIVKRLFECKDLHKDPSRSSMIWWEFSRILQDLWGSLLGPEGSLKDPWRTLRIIVIDEDPKGLPRGSI